MTVPVSESSKNELAVSMSALAAETGCLFSDFQTCKEISCPTKRSECILASKCEALVNFRALLVSIPSHLWVAIQPSHLSISYNTDEDLQLFKDFMTCQGTCIEDIFSASNLASNSYFSLLSKCTQDFCSPSLEEYLENYDKRPDILSINCGQICFQQCYTNFVFDSSCYDSCINPCSQINFADESLPNKEENIEINELLGVPNCGQICFQQCYSNFVFDSVCYDTCVNACNNLNYAFEVLLGGFEEIFLAVNNLDSDNLKDTCPQNCIDYCNDQGGINQNCYNTCIQGCLGDEPVVEETANDYEELKENMLGDDKCRWDCYNNCFTNGLFSQKCYDTCAAPCVQKKEVQKSDILEDTEVKIEVYYKEFLGNTQSEPSKN